MKRNGFVALFLGLALVGCEMSPAEKLLVVDGSGAVAGLLFLDRDADAVPSAGDLAAAEVSFALVRGFADTLATGTTNAGGIGVVTGLPVGSYRLLVDASALGDSLRLAESATVVVERGDTTSVVVALQHPPRTIREVRAAGAGKPVAVEGIALNAWTTFGDSTVHLADSTGAVRSIRTLGTPVLTGDSVRVVGRTASHLDDPVLADVTIYVRGGGDAPTPVVLSTRDAAAADGGALAAGLARIIDARVVDVTRLATGDHRVRVDDGSGVLEVFLDRHAGITLETPLIPGVRFDATGVLVPLGGGEWRLQPRSSADVEARVPAATIAGARAMSAGQVLSLVGVALNGWSVFGDGTVHLTDGTGVIRVIQSSGSYVAAGDSVQVVGVVAIVAGQTVLNASSSSILGRAATMPAPLPVASSLAATADGGKLDAALVRISDAHVDTVLTVSGETHLVIDDGSGPLTLLLDRDTGIGAAGVATGDRMNATGLLVPRGNGSWLLKPRTTADLSAGP